MNAMMTFTDEKITSIASNRRVATAIAAAMALTLSSGLAKATHYPAGTSCYACHTISSDKMVAGTRLIKQSAVTAQLTADGWTGGPVPCLFCHREGLVTYSPNPLDPNNPINPNRKMKPMDAQFADTVQSRHLVSRGAQFEDAAKFDCADCHNGVTAGGPFLSYVSGDGSGNANIHGLDAATQTVDIAQTLIGSPTSLAYVSATVCGNASCHGGPADNTVGGQIARKAHSFANGITLGTGAAPAGATRCTQCHASHRGEHQDKLLVLLADGTVDPQDGSMSAPVYVTPDKCGGCHSSDDGTAQHPDDYDLRGHGRYFPSLCTGCHSSNVSHDFTGANKRLGFTFSGPTSLLTDKSTYSICLACHSSLSGMAHDVVGTRKANVGCLDCHEPHGGNMNHGFSAYNGGYNVKMLRAKVPGYNQTMVFTGDPAYDYWDKNEVRGTDPDGSSRGLCDNGDCHNNPKFSPPKIPQYPMKVLLGAGGQHTGGQVTDPATCAGCHQHVDSKGTWGAGSACAKCHAYPPLTGVHLKHTDTVSGASLGCENCHPDPGRINHNEIGVTDKTDYQSRDPLQIRNAADVSFSQARYTTGAYSLAKGSRTAGTYGTCDNSGCHGYDLPVGVKPLTRDAGNTPKWDAPATGQCGACHYATAAAPPNEAGGSHPLHAGSTGGRAIGCQFCHATAYDGTKLLSGHVNGAVDVEKASTLAYNGSTVNFTYAAGSGCADISCHGAWKGVLWGAAAACANCHGTLDGTYAGGAGPDGMVPGVVAKHRESSWTNNLRGDNLETFGNGHKPAGVLAGSNNEGYCDYCHANAQSAYTPAKHIDGKVQLNANGGYSSATGGCSAACHPATAPYTMGTGNVIETLAGATATACDLCHLTAVGGVEADTHDYSYGNGTESRVNLPQWQAGIHGNSATGNLVCVSCHDAAVPHDVTADLSGLNPFRLKAGFSCTANGISCHAGKNSRGLNLPYDNIATHSAAAMGTYGYSTRYAWGYAPDCANCHDPHGDGNEALIRTDVRKGSAFSVPKPSIPIASSDDVITFTDRTTGASFSGFSYSNTTAPFASVCQTCHTKTVGFVRGSATKGGSYAAHPGGANPGNPGDCSLCHKHDSAFKPTGCNGCHGSLATGQYWPDGLNGFPPYADDQGGMHDKHIDAIAEAMGWTTLVQKNDSCSWCHPAPGQPRPGTLDAAHSTNGLDDNVVDVHGDGRIGATVTNFSKLDGTQNSGPGGYDNVSRTCLNLDCHNKFTTPPWNSAGTIGCAACHPNVVTHLKVLKTDTPVAQPYYASTVCTACHPGNPATPGFASKHSNNGGTVGLATISAPPTNWINAPGENHVTGNMQTVLGIDTDIHLGGDNPLSRGNSEAEVCWNCHGNVTNGVSEWGFNTKTTPPGFPVVSTFPTTHDGTAESEDFGWLYLSDYTTKVANWTQGYWMSEYDALLKRRVASVHAVNFDSATHSPSAANNVKADGTVERALPTMEAVGNLRCSYCHDVHDTFGPSGKPYLRGKWVGDPYPPELPPRSAYPYSTRVNTMGPNTPRGSSAARDRGGYFIDQNSGFPTSNPAMDTLDETAGLCTLCHGTNVDAMDYYTNSTLWRTGMLNGHSNSTLGGTGLNKRDLFTGSRYGRGMGMQSGVPYTPYNCGYYGDQCDPNYPQSQSMNWACYSDCYNLINSGWFGGAAGSGTQGGGDYGNWYGTGTVGGMSAPGQMAHKFTCSKCHSPHATGLPALLTQNCIDPSLGTFTINGRNGTNYIANNCHRKTTVNDGWHRLAPGQ